MWDWMRDRLPGREFRRRRLLRSAPPGPLRDYLSVPFPDRRADYRQVELVALDLETGGLDPGRDEILSVGIVSMRRGVIELATARRYLVRPREAIPEASAVIHRITDDRAALGQPLPGVLPDLLRRLAGRVLIAHHADIEQAFLDAACRRLYGAGFVIPVVDTLILGRRWLEGRDIPYRTADLRLHALRSRFGLPRYQAHDALADALAAAELFAAYVAHRGPETNAPLRLFLTAG